jgi:hypothetical protein
MPLVTGTCKRGSQPDLISIEGREYPISQTSALIAKNKEMYDKAVKANVNAQGVINFIELASADTKQYAASPRREQTTHPKTEYEPRSRSEIIVWQNHMGHATAVIIALKPKGELAEIAKQILELTNELYKGTEEKFA